MKSTHRVRRKVQNSNGNGTAQEPEKKYTEKAVAKLLKELGNRR